VSRRRWSWRIGSVGGVDLRIHASFLVLVAVVAVAGSTSAGPGAVPAVLWLVPLFASVLVHELAHTVVARHYGLAVTEIGLNPLGGLSKLAHQPDDPAVELRIALAGPLASIGLAVVCAVAALLTGSEPWPPTLYAGAVLVRLAWVNLVLGAFNLLPALPLDGGRVYRAALEERVGRKKATETAARVARDLAILLVIAGILVSPLLLVLGVIVYAASQAEAAGADLRDQLADLRVADVMRPSPIPLAPADLDERDAVLDPDEPLLSSGLLDHEPDVAAVVRDGELLGIVTAADVDRLVRRLSTPPVRRRSIPPRPPPPRAPSTAPQ
jgi:stage IV sporulation protein FB